MMNKEIKTKQLVHGFENVYIDQKKRDSSKSYKNKLKHASHIKTNLANKFSGFKKSKVKKPRIVKVFNKFKTLTVAGSVDKNVKTMPATKDLRVRSTKSIAGVLTQNATTANQILNTSSETHKPVEESSSKIRKKEYTGKGVIRRRLIGAGLVFLTLTVLYFINVLVFFFTFYPNTFIGDHCLSFKNIDNSNELIDDVTSNYCLNISNTNNFEKTINKDDINLKLDTNQAIAYFHNSQNPFLWPIELWCRHDLSLLVAEYYDHNLLKEFVANSVNIYNADQPGPVNATAVYNGSTNTFDVQSEKSGIKLDLDMTFADVEQAINHLHSNLILDDVDLLQPKLFKDDQRWPHGIQKALHMTDVQINIVKDEQTIAVPDKGTIGTWIIFDEEINPIIDSVVLNEYCSNLCDKFDNPVKDISYMRPNGKLVTVSGGSWNIPVDTIKLQTDLAQFVTSGKGGTAVIQNLTSANNLSNEPIFGNRYIDVDISEQKARLFDNGQLLWESDCVTGKPDGKHDTRLGVWTIIVRESPSILRGYTDSGQLEYAQKVSYWMCFDSIGIGLHDAVWLNSFGGTSYLTGPGSHGCVNLPLLAAQSLYSLTHYNDIVVVHR